MVQGHLADMALEIDAAALLVYRAAWTKDQGAPRVSREAAMAKLFATEAAQRVIDMAVQLHGGDGVRRVLRSKACIAKSARCGSTKGRATCSAS
jgi:acyl-CoA dehydrogenase